MAALLERVGQAQQEGHIKEKPLGLNQGVGAQAQPQGQAQIAAHHVPGADGDHQQQGPATEPARCADQAIKHHR